MEIEIRFVVARDRGAGEQGEGGYLITGRCKINKYWGCKVSQL